MGNIALLMIISALIWMCVSDDSALKEELEETTLDWVHSTILLIAGVLVGILHLVIVAGDWLFTRGGV